LTAGEHLSFLATLAAAYAESGDFDAAVRWQKMAEGRDPLLLGPIAPGSTLDLYLRKKPRRIE